MTAPTSAEGCSLCAATGFKILFRATDRLYGTTDKTFDLVKCDGCGLIRLSPRPTFAESAKYYPANYWFDPQPGVAGSLEELYRRWVLRDHLRFLTRALRDVAGESGRRGPVLDVGCGGGLLLGLLRQQNYEVAGLDLSPQAAALAWKRNSVPAAVGELARSPVAPNTCAAVTMFHVLEHIEQPECYLREAHRMLRPEGRLIVQVPNAASWQFALLGPAWNGVDTPRHFHLFRDVDVERLLEKCGFVTVRRKYFSLRDNPAGLATSLAPGLDPMARRVRGLREGPRERLFKDALYFALVLASLPFAAAEAMCRAGSTVMIEARKAA